MRNVISGRTFARSRGRHRLARRRSTVVSIAMAGALASAAAVSMISSSASAATSSNPLGSLDSATGTSARTIVLRGWAFDPDAPKSAIHVDVYVDGHGVRGTTSIARPDVVRAYPNAGPDTGYSVTTVAVPYGTHSACAYAINVGPGSNVALGCRSVTLIDPHDPKGSFALSVSGTSATARGYAYDPDSTAASIQVSYRVDSGNWANASAAATTPSAPVAGNHGYARSWSLPAGSHTVCVTALNIGPGTGNTSLGCHSFSSLTLNQRIAGYAKTFVGKYPYVDGGSSPSTGFDCSGLTSYIYGHYGRAIPRTAAGQFSAFHQISLSSALPGDLVFFHDSSGYVFHVGVYEGGNMMVAAATPQDGIRYQSVWSSAVTYGTITH